MDRNFHSGQLKLIVWLAASHLLAAALAVGVLGILPTDLPRVLQLAVAILLGLVTGLLLSLTLWREAEIATAALAQLSRGQPFAPLSPDPAVTASGGGAWQLKFGPLSDLLGLVDALREQCEALAHRTGAGHLLHLARRAGNGPRLPDHGVDLAEPVAGGVGR